MRFIFCTTKATIKLIALLYFLFPSFLYANIGDLRNQSDIRFGNPVSIDEDGKNTVCYASNGLLFGAKFNSNGICDEITAQKSKDGTWKSETIKLSQQEINSFLSANGGKRAWNYANGVSGGVAAILYNQNKQDQNGVQTVLVTDDYSLCAFFLNGSVTILPNHKADIYKFTNDKTNIQSADNSSKEYTKYNIAYGCSLELPINWKTTTELNNTLNDALKKGNEVNPETQLFSGANVDGSKVSVWSYFSTGELLLDQAKLAQISETEKQQIINKYKSALTNSEDVSCVDTTINKITNYYCIMSKILYKNDDKITCLVEIPLGKKILNLGFRCGVKDWQKWLPTFAAIMTYVKIANL